MSRRTIKTRMSLVDPFENACSRAIALLLHRIGLVREEIKECPESIDRVVKFSAQEGEIFVSQIKYGEKIAVLISETFPDYESCIRDLEQYEKRRAKTTKPVLKPV